MIVHRWQADPRFVVPALAAFAVGHRSRIARPRQMRIVEPFVRESRHHTLPWGCALVIIAACGGTTSVPELGAV
jgi:hypothetical protein